MSDISIRTLLSNKRIEKEQVVARGATASFTYTPTVFSIENLKQFVYSFGQKNNILQFKMYQYFTLTYDTSFSKYKDYYRKTGNIFVKVVTPSGGGNPMALGYYEIDETESSANKQLDPHFQIITSADPQYILFTMFSTDTGNLVPTTSRECVNVEVTAIINSSPEANVYIEAQPSFRVANTLYQISKEE